MFVKVHGADHLIMPQVVQQRCEVILVGFIHPTCRSLALCILHVGRRHAFYMREILILCMSGLPIILHMLHCIPGHFMDVHVCSN